MTHNPPVKNPYLHLVRNAEENPDGIFVHSKEMQLTNAQADLLIRKLATRLGEIGVCAGDLIALDVPGVLGVVFGQTGLLAGIITAEIPYGELSPEIPFTHFFSTDPESKYCPVGAERVTVDSAFLASVSASEPISEVHQFSSLEDTFRVFFTSGTTGRPKACEFKLGGYESVSNPDENHWMRDMPCITQMPGGSVFGFALHLASIKANEPILLLSGFTTEEYVAAGRQLGVRSIKGSPMQLSQILDVLENSGETLAGMKSIFVSGATLLLQAKSRALRIFPAINFYEIYGSSETLASTVKTEEDPELGYVGMPTQDAQVRITDNDGNPLPAGIIGHVGLKHAWSIKEYLGSPGLFAQKCRDGWFYPGDLGKLRGDGGVVITGRSTEVLNAGGVKIDPAIIEEAALIAGGISTCAAFVVADKSGAESFALAFVPRPEFEPSAFARRLQAELPQYMPNTLIKLESLPLSRNGKVVRSELSKQYSQFT